MLFSKGTTDSPHVVWKMFGKPLYFMTDLVVSQYLLVLTL